MKWIWIVILPFNLLFSQNITIGPGGDFRTLSEANGTISAGDSVMVLNGVYQDGSQFLYDLKGNPSNPILIYAQTTSGVIFRGGTESIHLVNAEHVILEGFIIEGQTGNGINIDDGGDYDTPTKFVEVRQCTFRDIGASGNRDFLKLSGLDSFHIHDCTFLRGGDGGSGIDMVGCHHGIIEDNKIEDAGATGIQAKGGAQHITIRRNVLINMSERALNLGGSTGFAFFRPPIQRPFQNVFEAADLSVYSNLFIGSRAPIAYVGCVRVHVVNNTFVHPNNWVIRILQETTEPGFLTCSNNSFRNNIVFISEDLREVNIGPNTAPSTFHFAYNNWYNTNDPNYSPQLPVIDTFQTMLDPLFVDIAQDNYRLKKNSSCIGQGKLLPFARWDFDLNRFLDPPSQGAFEGGQTTNAVDFDTHSFDCIVFPNPSSGQLILKSNDALISLDVFDLTGELVYSHSLKEMNYSLNLDFLKRGIYYLIIRNSEGESIVQPWLKSNLLK